MTAPLQVVSTPTTERIRARVGNGEWYGFVRLEDRVEVAPYRLRCGVMDIWGATCVRRRGHDVPHAF